MYHIDCKFWFPESQLRALKNKLEAPPIKWRFRDFKEQ
jgi:hypothetical protein